MKAKFEEFNDGIADVYCVNGEDRLEKIKKGLRFGNENVGITRHYAAQAADTRVVLSLIHISEPTRPLYISYAVFCLKKKITLSI